MKMGRLLMTKMLHFINKIFISMTWNGIIGIFGLAFAIGHMRHNDTHSAMTSMIIAVSFMCLNNTASILQELKKLNENKKN